MAEEQRKSGIILPAKPEAKPETKEETKVSESPAMMMPLNINKAGWGLGPQGMFVVSIPLNKTSRAFALGVMWDAMVSLTDLLNKTAELKAKNKKNLTDGVREFFGKKVGKA